MTTNTTQKNMTAPETLWSCPISHAIDDFIDENAAMIEVEDINILYLAERILEIVYLQKQVNAQIKNRELLVDMILEKDAAEKNAAEKEIVKQ